MAQVTRRFFLGSLGAAAAGLALDPERLLWVPGQRKIFIPAPARVVAAAAFTRGDVITIAGRYAINPLTREPVQRRDGTKFLQQLVVTEDVRAGQEILPRGVCPAIARASRGGDWETQSRRDFYNGEPLAPGDHVAEPYKVGEVVPATFEWATYSPAGPARGFVHEPPAAAFRPEARDRLLGRVVG